MPDIEALLADFAERGLSDEDIAELREATSATPLRQEIKQISARNKELEGKLMRSTFAELGITMNPDALNVPSDLDATDPAKVREWATSMNLPGLLPDPNAITDDEKAAHASIAGAGVGAASGGGQIKPEDVADWSMAQRVAFSKNNPEKWASLKNGDPVPA